MAITWTRQDTEIRNSDVYEDNTLPSEAAYETNAVHIEDDLNNLRSAISYLKDVQAGNWWDLLAAPTNFENGAARGVDGLNQSLHDLERKRVLDYVNEVGKDVTVPAGTNVAILTAAQLPTSTTANVGGTSTLGTMVAGHAGTFGDHSVDIAAGPNALAPLNKVQVFDASTGDVLTSNEREIFGLLQSESTTDGHTITDATPSRVQISFVRPNATYDAFEPVPVADIENKEINYAYIQQYALADLPRHAFLGNQVGEAGASSVSRQAAYDNQGTGPVTLANDAFLDLDGAGTTWAIRDLGDGSLFQVTEDSAAGASTVTVGQAVDAFDVNAVDVDFASGISTNTTGTRPIDVGVQDGIIESTAGALEVQSAAALSFDDGNKPTDWSLEDGVKLSDNSTDWEAFEAAFGEVSLMNAIVQAKASGGSVRGTKTYANVTADAAPDTDVGGTGGGANLDNQLPDMTMGFFAQHDVYVNGRLLRPGADDTANNDYYPGTDLATGQLKFERRLKVGDVVCVVTWN